MIGDALTPRDARGALATIHRDPRDQWPEHARKLYDGLVDLYGEGDPLPTLAAARIAHQRSVNAQRSYARGFRVFEEFAREHGLAGEASALRVAMACSPRQRILAWLLL
ncbi:hypothetical protein ACWDF9_08315 [Streptomyces rubiginosohelvolus]